MAESKRAITTSAPASAAAKLQGVMLASWSRLVTTTRSPGRQLRARARLNEKVREVMFWPKTTSPGVQPKRSAPARRAPSVISAA